MRPETLVRVHILEVIALLNDMEIMRALIDEETQVDIVLETLSDSFDTFKLNYSMNKLSYNLTELMKELQAVEALFSKGKNKGDEAHLFVNRASTYGIKRFRPNKSRKGSRPPQRPNEPPVAKVEQPPGLLATQLPQVPQGGKRQEG